MSIQQSVFSKYGTLPIPWAGEGTRPYVVR